MENAEISTVFQSYTVIEKIAEGYSGDDKYKLEKDGKYYLLRVGDKSKLAEKRQEYDRLGNYADKGINTHRPVMFHTTGDKFYSLVSWVDGTPVMDIIKKDASQNYYQLGKKVGIELKKLHLASPIDAKTDWKDTMERKADVCLENCRRMNVEFACSKCAEQYILENISLMSDRPQVALHGDFHWNNCVVDDKGNVGIIDFSGNNVGDPWYEFGGLLWALEYSDSFANGQIDGYFGAPPSEFWDIFKFYVALYAFEHFMYSDGTPEDIRYRICNASRMLNIYGEAFELKMPIFRRLSV